MTQPISRAELIHAGAPFTVKQFKVGSRFNDLEQREWGEHWGVEDRLADMEGKDVRVWLAPQLDAACIQPVDDVYALRADISFLGRGYEKLIAVLEECDPEATGALQRELPKPLQPEQLARCETCFYPRIHGEVAKDYGLDPDAMLYAAVSAGDRHAAGHYLSMGADPIRPTHDGDCAARAGVASMMWDVFPDHLDARHLATGRTGLHDLNSAKGHLRRAIELGADMYWADNKGMTIAATLGDPLLRTSLLEFQAQHRASHLDKVLPPAQDWAPSADGGKALGDRLHGQESAGEQPVRVRRPGLRL